MEYYSTIKKNEIFPFQWHGWRLENIMLSEISQSKKDKYHMISLICRHSYVGFKKQHKWWGAWVAQLVKCSTLAQVIISRFVGSSSVLGSVLTAQSLEPASDSLSPSLFVPPPLTVSVSQKWIKTLKKFKKKTQHKPANGKKRERGKPRNRLTIENTLMVTRGEMGGGMG